MRPALLITPDLRGQVNQAFYLADCIKSLQADGYLPISPVIYQQYTGQSQEEFAEQALPIAEAVFIFTDFGEDETTERILQLVENKELIFRRQLTVIDRYKNTLPTILLEVSSKTEIPLETLKSKSRKQPVVDARFVYYKRAHELTKEPYVKIGGLVNRDHASVSHGLKEMSRTKPVRELYKKCFDNEPT